jgi:hypothetical protein
LPHGRRGDEPGRGGDVMQTKRFMTNFTAGFCSSRCFFMPPHYLHTGSEIENIDLFHIYVIVRAPKVRLIPNSIKFDGSRMNFSVKSGHEFSLETLDYWFPEDWGVTEFDASDAGGRSFRMISKIGIEGGDFPMLWMKNTKYTEAKYHEVIYIGQAYGLDGNRNVINRLERHETLQKIVSENSVHFPETDVYVYGFQYQNNDSVQILFNGRDKSLISGDEDTSRVTEIMANPIGDREMTSIVEAGLIRYFQPEYNEKFKELFPNSKYGFLSDLKHFGYEGFVVEIDTEDLGTVLKSKVVGNGMHHIATYQIKPGLDVNGSISFLGLMEGTGLHPSSGPTY